MYINPITAIQNGWISHPSLATIEDWQEADTISPNAIDFTVDNMFSINSGNVFTISEEGKTMRGGDKLSPTEGVYVIAPNTVVDCLSSMYLNIPEGVVCELIIRSTLNRNGLFLTSGLYDSGFSGNIGFAIHNSSGIAHIAPGTRVGQIKFMQSDSEGLYKGGWNHKQGEHWTESNNGETK